MRRTHNMKSPWIIGVATLVAAGIVGVPSLAGVPDDGTGAKPPQLDSIPSLVTVPAAVLNALSGVGNDPSSGSNPAVPIMTVPTSPPATTAPPSPNPEPTASTPVQAVASQRLVDTRSSGSSSPGQPAVTPDNPLAVQVLGVAGVPDGGVTAVVLNVTATRATGDGFVTVWPCGTRRPDVSNLNIAAGRSAANLVLATPGRDGTVCVHASTGLDVLVDVAGWLPTGGAYRTTTPRRLADTRALTPVTPDAPLVVEVAGRAGVGDNATAVAVNVTVTRPSADGFVTVWPCGVARPEASNVNFTAGQTIPNAVIAPLGGNGSLCVHASAPTDVLVDVTGWFSPAAGFTPLTPRRLVDTRATTALVADVEFAMAIAGRPGVPSAAAAVAVNVTVTRPVTAGFVTVWPCGSPKPATSTVNFEAGQTIANAMITPVGLNGRLCAVSSAETDLIVDATGWFRG